MGAVISPGELSWQKNPVYSHVNHHKLFVHVISLSIYRQRIRLFMSDSKIVDTALGTAKTRMTKPALEHHKVLLQLQPGRVLHSWLHFQGWSYMRGLPRSAEPSEKLLKAEIKGKARPYPLVLFKKIHVWITYLIRWTWLINLSPLLGTFEVLDAWISKCDAQKYGV